MFLRNTDRFTLLRLVLLAEEHGIASAEFSALKNMSYLFLKKFPDNSPLTDPL
jgi:hypothetical protein